MNKKTKTSLVILIVLLIILVVSGSYAFYNPRLNKSGDSIANVTTKKLSIRFQDGPKIYFDGVLPGKKSLKPLVLLILILVTSDLKILINILVFLVMDK